MGGYQRHIIRTQGWSTSSRAGGLGYHEGRGQACCYVFLGFELLWVTYVTSQVSTNICRVIPVISWVSDTTHYLFLSLTLV